MKIKILFIFIILKLCYTERHDNYDEKDDADDDDKPYYIKPIIEDNSSYYLIETFDTNNINNTKWIISTNEKYDHTAWSIEATQNYPFNVHTDDEKFDYGLVLKSKSKHHAISTYLFNKFNFKDSNPLIIQYEVKFQNLLQCGGAYIKLLTDNKYLNLKNFTDKTAYTIMFGPDKCGSSIKYHFIIRYKNPITGEYEEKHAKQSYNIESYFNNHYTHLFTLILNPDNKFKMYIDKNIVNYGNLLNDFTPSINPDYEIYDINDKKPNDWDDRKLIEDPFDTKPPDWDDEPEFIIDKNDRKPNGWLDNEEPLIDYFDKNTNKMTLIQNPKCKNVAGCGKWLPKMINNPKYKGIWKAKMVENKDYTGEWIPKKIINKNYYYDGNPFSSLDTISAIGIELWSLNNNIYFDNIIITNNETEASQFAKITWLVKYELEMQNETYIEKFIKATTVNPWLWIVFIIVCILPVSIFIVYCCDNNRKLPKFETKNTTNILNYENKNSDSTTTTNINKNSKLVRNNLNTDVNIKSEQIKNDQYFSARKRNITKQNE